MTNFKNNRYTYITDKRTVPSSSNGTGTISTEGLAVFGTGTLFKTEMPAGSWLVVAGDNEYRYVERVDSDTLAYIRNAFTSDISPGTTPDIIHVRDTNIVAISVQIPAGLVDGELDGEVFPAGTSVTISKDSRDRSGPRDLIDPIIVDASGTSMQVLTIK